MGATNNRLLLADYLNGQQSSSFGRNYVLNPSGFENVNNISVSNSATVSRNTTSPLTAVSDIQIALTSDTNDSVTWTLNTLDNSLNGQNCMLSFDYTASSMGSAVQAQVLQGSNISATVTLNPASTSKNVILNTPCGNLGSATTVVITNVTGNSGSSALHVANVNYGKATNIGTVAQAQLIGQVKITGCASSWSTSSVTFTDFSAQSGCTYTVTAGNASAPSTEIPGISFASLPPGNYTLKYEGLAQVASAPTNAEFQFWDGTNTANEISYVGQATAAEPGQSPGIQQTISYLTPQSSITFSIRGLVGDGSASANIFGMTGVPGVISVYYYPTQSQLVQTPNNSNGNWSGISTLSGTTTSESITDPGSIVGSVITSGTPQNISCTQDATYLGIDCTLPQTGNYQVCVTGNTVNSVSGQSNQWELTDGSNNAIIPASFVYTGAADAFAPMSGCANYTATSTSVLFKIRGATTGDTATFSPLAFSVTSLATSLTGAISPGSVTSSGAGQYHQESLYFYGTGSGSFSNTTCASDPCSVSGYTGSGTVVVNRSSAGHYVIHFPSGEFSSAPNCTFAPQANESIWSGRRDIDTATTVYVISGSSTWSAYQDDAFTVICMGPH